MAADVEETFLLYEYIAMKSTEVYIFCLAPKHPHTHPHKETKLYGKQEPGKWI